MTHFFELDGELYKKVKDGHVDFLIVSASRTYKTGEEVFIQSRSHPDEIRTHITFVTTEKTKGINKDFRIINIHNK